MNPLLQSLSEALNQKEKELKKLREEVYRVIELEKLSKYKPEEDYSKYHYHPK